MQGFATQSHLTCHESCEPAVNCQDVLDFLRIISRQSALVASLAFQSPSDLLWPLPKIFGFLPRDAATVPMHSSAENASRAAARSIGPSGSGDASARKNV